MVALTTRIIYPSSLLFLQEVKLMRKIKVEKKKKKQKKAEEKTGGKIKQIIGGITFEGDFAQEFFKDKIEEDNKMMRPPSKEHIRVDVETAKRLKVNFNELVNWVKVAPKSHKLKMKEVLDLDNLRNWLNNHIDFFEVSLLEVGENCNVKECKCEGCNVVHHHSFRQNRKSNKKIFNIAYAHLKAEEEGRGCRLKDPTKCKACSYVVQLHRHNNTPNLIGDLTKMKKTALNLLYNIENPYQEIISKVYEMKKKWVIHYYQGEPFMLKGADKLTKELSEQMSHISIVRERADYENSTHGYKSQIFAHLIEEFGEENQQTIFDEIDKKFEEIHNLLSSRSESFAASYPEYIPYWTEQYRNYLKDLMNKNEH